MKFRYILPVIILVLNCCKNPNNEISIDQGSKILSNKATEFIVNKDYKKATDLLNKAIEKDSKNYFAYIGKTTIFIKEKNYKLALKQIEKVIEIKPDFAESWTMKGMLNDILNNKEQAISDYEKSIKYFESRKEKENFDEKINDINIYYSLYLIDN